MKRCINCDYDNDDHAKRCERCGRLIDVKTDVTDGRHNYRCKNCEEIISAKYTYKDLCPYCRKQPGGHDGSGFTNAIFIHRRFKGL